MIERTISLLIAWATLIGGIWVLFHAMEVTASPVAKRMAANWLKSMGAKSILQTIVESPRWFIEAFDRIFGKRHLTFRCFSRSCVASIMAVFVLTIMWAVLDPTSCEGYLSRFPTIEAISGIFILALILNIFPDYISLLETRWILHLAAEADIKRLIALLLIDVIITGGIFAFGAAIFFLLSPLGTDEYLQFMSTGIQFMPINPGGLVPGIFFYSTYFTSVWLYMFIASRGF